MCHPGRPRPHGLSHAGSPAGVRRGGRWRLRRARPGGRRRRPWPALRQGGAPLSNCQPPPTLRGAGSEGRPDREPGQPGHAETKGPTRLGRLPKGKVRGTALAAVHRHALPCAVVILRGRGRRGRGGEGRRRRACVGGSRRAAKGSLRRRREARPGEARVFLSSRSLCRRAQPSGWAPAPMGALRASRAPASAPRAGRSRAARPRRRTRRRPRPRRRGRCQ
jgi:hypothetical protein